MTKKNHESIVRRLNILPDGHVGIKKYDPPEELGFRPSKKRATFYIGGQDEQRTVKESQ